jgi:hypothetical protein
VTVDEQEASRKVASVKDAQQLVQHVESALSELKDALRSDGNLDFERIACLADEIAERADTVAETFSSLNEVLMGRIDEISGNRKSSSSTRGSSSGGRKRAKAAS